MSNLLNERGHQAILWKNKLFQNVWERKGSTQNTAESQKSLRAAGKRQEKSGQTESGDNNHIVHSIFTS